jgi:arsenical pump membrane protein
VVNNLPATLVMITALAAASTPAAGAGWAAGSHAAFVLAMIIGVIIGPNLTYAGSLATLPWRRVLAGRHAAPTLTELLRLGALSVPLCLLAATVALWLGLTVGVR